MDPFHVLGVEPTASIEEIETRYRLLLREYHPDMHQGEGPEALALAEQMTRRLNDAIARIRAGEVDELDRLGGEWSRPSSRGWYGDRSGGFAGFASPRAGEDWFAPPREDEDERRGPVPCPFCGAGYERLDDFQVHLERYHRFRNATAKPPRRGGFLDTIGKVRYVPVWLVLMVAVGLWISLGFWWFVAGESFLALVLWAQTSKRFKNRRLWDL